MHSPSPPAMAKFFLFVLLAATCTAAGLLPFVSAATSGGFSADLIHRDSPLSPLYDPSSTPLSRLGASFNRTHGRAAHFCRATNTSTHSQIVPNSFEYLMTLSIGTPPVETLAVVDTGSDLTWLQCAPCPNCYPQTPPLFNPAASSSYKPFLCRDFTCSAVPQHGDCFSNPNCNYEYSDADGSHIIGELATETLSFGSAASFPNIIFGCTHESNGSFDADAAGLVGLGGGSLSLMSQLREIVDNKFSYCLPSLVNSSARGWISFGAEAVVTGPGAVTTDLVRSAAGNFMLSLEQISVAGDSEAISLKSLNKVAGLNTAEKGNIIIDSGTTLTLIDDESLRSLIAKLSTVVKWPRVRDPVGMFGLCFDVSGAKGGDEKMPDIIFRFSGADVVLKPLNSFVAMDERTLCLGMASSGTAFGVSIFGSMAQQNFNVEYDLAAMKLTVKPSDCRKV